MKATITNPLTTHIMKNYPTIQESLRATRKAKGWSQEETARRCGMSLNTYTRIETGKSSTTLKTLQHICETLGVQLAIVSQ